MSTTSHHLYSLFFMLALPLVSALLTATAVSAGPLPLARRGYATKETHYVPRDWIVTSTSHPDQTLKLNIAVKQSRPEDFDAHLLAISHPDSPQYGDDFLTNDEIAAYNRPHQHHLEAVLAWLAEHGVEEHHLSFSHAKDWISLKIPVSKANYMLDTKFHTYTHSSGAQVNRVTSWSLPVYLHDIIDTIQPTTYFSGLHAQRSTIKPFLKDEAEKLFGVSNLASDFAAATNPGNNGDVKDGVPFYCNRTVSVACIRELYQTSDYEANPDNGNKLGITGYLEEYANKHDLEVFLAGQRPEAKADFTTELINGGINPQDYSEFNSTGGTEAGLDIQFGVGISWPTPNLFYSTAGRPPSTLEPNDAEPYLEWVQAILNMDPKDVPNVISTSYGEPEYSVPEYYMRRVCQLFGEVSARGTTLLFSSGDDGVADFEDGCPGPNNSTRFAPSFPASCPYVTAVGGTENIPNESAVSRFGSGAGFSDFWPMPEWQKSVVTEYLDEKANQTLLATYDGYFNRSGRAYPDVAAQGDRYSVYVPGTYNPRNDNSSGWGLIGGTSASCPTFGAILSQLVDYRLENGKKSFGWFNPLLYSKLSSGFTDITKGSSFGCDLPGFPAAEGWDAVTGFGTPLFKTLQKLVL